MALDLRMDTHIEIQLVCVPDDDSANASLDLRWTRTTRCNLDPATTRTSQPPPTLSSTPCVPETLKVDPGLMSSTDLMYAATRWLFISGWWDKGRVEAYLSAVPGT
eukprot:2729418-Rhodomonas_salina.1